MRKNMIILKRLRRGGKLKAFILINDKEKKYDVIIKNKYLIQIITESRMPSDIKLIKTFDENGKKISMINCRKKSLSIQKDGLTSFTYKCSYILTDWLEDLDLDINGLSVHFREVDYMWIKHQYKPDLINDNIILKKKIKSHSIYDNNLFVMSVHELYGINTNENGQTVINFPCRISLSFKEKINLTESFKYIKQLESCFGFMVGHKLNSLSVNIKINDERNLEILSPYIKEYKDCKEKNSNIVDLDSSLIKKIVKGYFEDSYLRVAINNFYEYIYNSLDPILEFISLCNSVEILSNHDEYKSKIIRFSKKMSKSKKRNNKIFENILQKTTDEERRMLKNIYSLDNTSLKDKLAYLFHHNFELQINKNSIQFLSKLNNTRNFYVHGTKRKIFNYDETEVASILLRASLYVEILKICEPEIVNNDNIIITANKETIKNCFNYFKLL